MIAAYFSELVHAFGQSWNRFWYTPAQPLPLGVMRVLVGLIALVSLLTYTPDIDLLLSNEGMMSVDTVVELQTVRRESVVANGNESASLLKPWRWSYFDYLYGRDLHIAHWLGVAVIAVFTVGLCTRATSIAALVVMLSYLHRTPQVTEYHERILAFLLFYLAVGPAGATLSLDRLLKARRGAPAPAPLWSAGVVLRLIQIHLAVVCFMMAFAKLSTGSSTWWPGMAIWWLSIMPDASLVQIPWRDTIYQKFIINFWTHAIVAFEMAFPFLCWKPLARPLLVPLGIVIWTSVMVVTGQVLFCLALMTALLSFISGEQMLRLIGRGKAG